ncbi:MAG TPA: enolase C-terminal domain-like protein [Candidatus Nitrosotalea sp.]|nr:enolase C-terminal domain-like protein [Candidatus Nitrosotalea sp.]
MVVTGATITGVAVPYRPELGTVITAGLELTEARHVILQLHTDQGLTGLGEAVPRPSVYGETMESITAAMRDLLLPPVLGLDALDVEKVWARWSRVVANTTAKAAIDMALHDIAGQMAQMPLYKMLGGWSDGHVRLAMPLGISDLADVVRRAGAALEQGFDTLKLKIGRDSGHDVAVVQAVRRAVGPQAKLYVDANQGYTAREALRVIPRLEEFGIELVEEPVPVEDVAGRTRIAHSVAIPLLLDESITTSADVLREIQLGNAGALSIRSPRSGFTATRKMLGLAEAASVPCLVGSHRELGVGTAASAHLAAAYRCMRYPAELGVHTTLEDGLLEEPIQIVGGWLTAPSGPGLGVRLDAAKVARYRIWSTSVGEIGA